VTAGAPPCRSSTSDSQLWQLTTEIHTAAATKSTQRARRRLPALPRDRGVSPLPPQDVSTVEPKRKTMMPTVAHQPTTANMTTNDTTGNDDTKQKPAAKLESYAGQGASLESFIAQFKSHAKYFKWTEQDRVFQLKNSLTGIAAQALWTGGEHATSAELIQILHSRHGGKLQTECFWSELRARRRRKDEPLQEVCQEIRRLM